MRPSINNVKYTIKINLYVSLISLIPITEDCLAFELCIYLKLLVQKQHILFSIKATSFDINGSFTLISSCSMVNTV